jgi:hypothetical protein
LVTLRPAAFGDVGVGVGAGVARGGASFAGLGAAGGREGGDAALVVASRPAGPGFLAALDSAGSAGGESPSSAPRFKSREKMLMRSPLIAGADERHVLGTVSSSAKSARD